MKLLKKAFVFILIPLVLLGANIWVVLPLFSGEFTTWRGSIETAYMAVARFIKEFFPHISWHPFWYNGYPFHTFYNPVFPYLEAFISSVSSWSVPKTYRVLTGLAYCFGPASFYFLVLYLTQTWYSALPAALAYSFLPSVVYLFTPYAHEAGERLNFPPWRANALVLYGEGPHTFCLLFVPIALIFTLKAFTQKRPKFIFWAAVFIGLIALTNMIGMMSLALLFLIFFLVQSRTGQQEGDLWQIAGQIFLLSYGLVAFWYNFSFIKRSFLFGRGDSILGSYLSLFPFGLLFLVWIFGMVYLLVRFKKKTRSWILAGVWILVFGLVTYFGYARNQALLPQPKRYVPYFDMGLYLLAGLLISVLVQKLARLKFVGVVLNVLMVFVVCGLILYFSGAFLKTAREMVKPEINWQNWGEYQNARWFAQNAQGERVYATGNTAFWMNTFFPQVMQVKGSLDQGATNPWRDHMQYQIYHGQDAELAEAMLKIFNASYILVNLPGSSDPYKDFTYPEKFARLDKVWQQGNDIVYQVLLKDNSFAQVVDLEQGSQLKEPINGADKPAFLAYLEWMQANPGLASFEKVNNDKYKITAQVKKGQGVLVQMNHDPGWQAGADRTRVQVEKDILGHLLLAPSASGNLEIIIKHGRTWDIWLGYLLTLVTVIYLAYLYVVKRSRAGKK